MVGRSQGRDGHRDGGAPEQEVVQAGLTPSPEPGASDNVGLPSRITASVVGRENDYCVQCIKYIVCVCEFDMVSQARITNLIANDFVGPAAGPTEDLGHQLHRKKIIQAVKASPDGISTVDVARVAGVSVPTAKRILAELEKEREVYSRTHTEKRIMIWYPNGKIIHQYLEVQRELRGKTYRVTAQEGRAGPVVQIQERRFSLLDGEHVEGAIFVDYESVGDLCELLSELKRRYESFESGRLR